MPATTGVWFACALSLLHSFESDHQTRLLEMGWNRVITSEEVRNGPNSEVGIAAWAAADSTRPRMIPGQTRSDIAGGVMLMYAHRETGTEAQHADRAYTRLRPVIDGVEGFLVYHEWGTLFPGLTPVMDRLTVRFRADRGHDPELWAVDDRGKSMQWGTFYEVFWGYSDNTIFMSEKYNWRGNRTPIQRIEDFEVGENGSGGIITTAEDARAWRSRHGWACRWTAIVAAHQDDTNRYYTPGLTELRFTSLLPIGLGAEGIIYYVFDLPSIPDDLYRNATVRQNIATLKPRIDWLRDRLTSSPYTYVGWNRNTYQDEDGNWQWIRFTDDESLYLDRIEEESGDASNQLKRLTIGVWQSGTPDQQAWAITSRDPWTGNHSYTAYFKRPVNVVWDGSPQGPLTQFTFMMSPGDTKLLETWISP